MWLSTDVSDCVKLRWGITSKNTLNTFLRKQTQSIQCNSIPAKNQFKRFDQKEKACWQLTLCISSVIYTGPTSRYENKKLQNLRTVFLCPVRRFIIGLILRFNHQIYRLRFHIYIILVLLGLGLSIEPILYYKNKLSWLLLSLKISKYSPK